MGVPVYNEENYLRETLESLLAQTCGDFEIIVSDNASTDGTEAICREFAAADPRLRYIRQTANIGAPANWNFVAREARGRYFKWSSASDLVLPHFLQSCIQPMEADSSIVLCYGKTSYIDGEGKPFQFRDNDVEALEERPSERFERICQYLSVNNEQYGLMRRDALLKTRLDRMYPHGDLVLMAELALLGKFKLLSEHLLIRRAAEGHWTGMMPDEEINALFWPGARPKARIFYIRRHLDYLWTAMSSPVSIGERLRAFQYALRLAYWRKRELRRELGVLLLRNGTPKS
jgi:glycosyltransferase involved in cell wall biosynthesis